MNPTFSIQWHLTDACDQRCKHCYIFAEDNAIPIRTMPWDGLQKIVRNCQEMCASLGREPYFYITGGDPLLHPDFWRLTGLLKQQNLRFSIMGNPFHLTDDVCNKLYSEGCERYQMSIDGLQETHDRIRKSGSFDATFQKIDSIRKAGLKSAIMTTVSSANMHELPGIIDSVVKAHADVFAFARYCPTSSPTETHITPSDYRNLLDICWHKFEEYKDAGTTFNLKDHLWTLYLYEKGLFKIQENLEPGVIYDGCNCGISHLTILPGGEVYACRRMESGIGNIFKDNLLDIFLGTKMGRYREFDKFEKCSHCELLRFCRGCPAVAFGYTGSHLCSDPQCWKLLP